MQKLLHFSNEITHNKICFQVSNNGYISMGAQVNLATPTIPGTNTIVSPYGADIDTSGAGTVRYTTEFITYHPYGDAGFIYHPDIIRVSNLISTITAHYYFYGRRKRVMVVEWDHVPLRGLSDPAHVCLHAHFHFSLF